MTKIYDKVKEYLEQEPRARERQNHARGMVNLLLKNYPTLKEIPKETLIDFCRDFDSYIREWREVVRLEPHLRGLDYNDKIKLEQEYQLGRGYDPNYQNDNRKLKTLF